MKTIAHRKNLEIYNENCRDNFNRRKKISFAVFSYFDEFNNEYRKKFTSVPYTTETKFWELSPERIIVEI